MESETLTLVLFSLSLLFAVVLKRRQSQRPVPPGPRLYRLVIQFLKKRNSSISPHTFLSGLADEYGPVMTLPLGPMTAVVISTADTARELFKRHDLSVSDRMVFESMKVSPGNEGTLITSQMGPEWRMLRRLWAVQFFTSARIDSFESARRSSINSLIRTIEERGELGNRPFELRWALFTMALDHFGHIALSRSLLKEAKSEEGSKFYYHSKQIMKLVGKPNIADYIPLLRWIDPQGIRKKMNVHVLAGIKMMAGFVEERKRMIKEERAHEPEGAKKNFLDVLLEFRGDGVDEPVKLSPQAITNIIMVCFSS